VVCGLRSAVTHAKRRLSLDCSFGKCDKESREGMARKEPRLQPFRMPKETHGNRRASQSSKYWKTQPRVFCRFLASSGTSPLHLARYCTPRLCPTHLLLVHASVQMDKSGEQRSPNCFTWESLGLCILIGNGVRIFWQRCVAGGFYPES
jgi:hypothetical protein